MYRKPKKEFFCNLLIQGMSTIAPSYDPIYRFFFAVAFVAIFGVRLYVSIVLRFTEPYSAKTALRSSCVTS
jgi:hypothetical protein